MKRILSIFFILSVLSGSSQTELTKQVDQLMGQVRSGAAITVDRNKILNAPAKESISALRKYFADTVDAVRYEALSLGTQLVLKAKEQGLARAHIHDLIAYSVIGQTINNQVAGLLKKFKPGDFSLSELSLMKEVMEARENNIGTMAKIYAFAGGTADGLHALLAKPTLSKSDKKDIRLALVRTGDQALAQKMSQALSEQVFNDELIYSALPEILYTKNKTLYTQVLNAILSDAKKCSSANNDDNTPIICAYRLIEQVAPHITGFPVTINDKGEIDTKDISASLVLVREWIAKNKESFVINTLSY